MFSATMPEELKKDCKKFLQNEVDIFIDEGKLILHGLAQFYIYIQENKKFEKGFERGIKLSKVKG